MPDDFLRSAFPDRKWDEESANADKETPLPDAGADMKEEPDPEFKAAFEPATERSEPQRRPRSRTKAEPDETTKPRPRAGRSLPADTPPEMEGSPISKPEKTPRKPGRKKASPDDGIEQIQFSETEVSTDKQVSAMDVRVDHADAIRADEPTAVPEISEIPMPPETVAPVISETDETSIQAPEPVKPAEPSSGWVKIRRQPRSDTPPEITETEKILEPSAPAPALEPLELVFPEPPEIFKTPDIAEVAQETESVPDFSEISEKTSDIDIPNIEVDATSEKPSDEDTDGDTDDSAAPEDPVEKTPRQMPVKRRSPLAELRSRAIAVVVAVLVVAGAAFAAQYYTVEARASGSRALTLAEIKKVSPAAEDFEYLNTPHPGISNVYRVYDGTGEDLGFVYAAHTQVFWRDMEIMAALRDGLVVNVYISDERLMDSGFYRSFLGDLKKYALVSRSFASSSEVSAVSGATVSSQKAVDMINQIIDAASNAGN